MASSTWQASAKRLMPPRGIECIPLTDLDKALDAGPVSIMAAGSLGMRCIELPKTIECDRLYGVTESPRGPPLFIIYIECI